MGKNKTERDRMIIDGVITETCKGGLFRVECGGNIILAKPCGQMQKNTIKIIVGDCVKVEVCAYDLTKGRIVSRIKKHQVSQ
jgi:translation initiation factor IF-1